MTRPVATIRATRAHVTFVFALRADGRVTRRPIGGRPRVAPVRLRPDVDALTKYVRERGYVLH